MRPARLAPLALLPLALAAGRASGDSPSALEGTVEILGLAGREVRQAGTVVWIPGVAVEGALPGRGAMESHDKRFDPHVVVVSRGETVTFPNADPIYHNVFSLSPGNAFDLGLYRKGAAKAVLFRTPGLVRVYCNIHPEMTGYVLVVEGSAFAVTAEDGSYRIAGVPPGRHAVRAWSEFGGETTATLDFQPGRPTTWDLSLDASSYRALPHRNKHGKDYPPATQDVDRY